jgi:hypothetical protein
MAVTDRERARVDASLGLVDALIAPPGPKTPWIRVAARARLLLRAGRFAEAEALVRTAAAEAIGKDYAITECLARARAGQGDAAGCLTLARSAAGSGVPADLMAREIVLEAARACLAAGSAATALQLLDTAFGERHPSQDEVDWLLWVRAAAKAGRRDRAREIADRGEGVLRGGWRLRLAVK